MNQSRALGVSVMLLVAAAGGCKGKSQGGGGGSGGNGGASAATTSGGQGGDLLSTTSSSSGQGGQTSCAPGALDLTGCACQPGAPPRDCYDGDPAKAGKGQCVMGKQECNPVPMKELGGGQWGACVGAGKPSPEVCDGKGDEDCDGVVDNGCGCTQGTTQMCKLPDGSGGTQTCQNGVWGPCQCMEGASQACVTAQGGNGVQVCTKNMWGPCVGNTCGGPITAGQPCNTPGISIPTPPNTCGCGDQGTKVTSIYCDDQGTWQCFPADDCDPAACTTCLTQHCGQFMSSGDPACDANLKTAWTWLEGCGPDRNAWFSNLDAACPGGNVSQLNQCKFQFCVMNGTCSFY